MRAETSLVREPHARDRRKTALDSSFSSDVSGSEYSGDESNKSTLSDLEIVGDLSAGT